MSILTFKGSVTRTNVGLDLDLFPSSTYSHNKQWHIGGDNSAHLGAHDQALFPPSLSTIAVAVGRLSTFYSTMYSQQSRAHNQLQKKELRVISNDSRVRRFAWALNNWQLLAATTKSADCQKYRYVMLEDSSS